MKKQFRHLLCLTLISAASLVCCDAASAKTALIERRGDRVHVTYKYGDGYQLTSAKPHYHRARTVRHEHVLIVPNYNWYRFPQNIFIPYNGYAYPTVYR